jgi:hypothetical protein
MEDLKKTHTAGKINLDFIRTFDDIETEGGEIITGQGKKYLCLDDGYIQNQGPYFKVIKSDSLEGNKQKEIILSMTEIEEMYKWAKDQVLRA